MQFLPQRGIETRLTSTARERERGTRRMNEEGECGKGRVEVLGTVVLAHLHYPRPGPKGIRVYNGRTVLGLDQLAYRLRDPNAEKTNEQRSDTRWDTRAYEKPFSAFCLP